MIKKFLIGILMALFLATAVSATGNLSIINPVQELQANVSETVTGNFQLNNTGTANLTSIELSSTQLAGSRMSLSSSIVTFAPASTIALLNSTEQPTINYSVALAGLNAFAGTYQANISAIDSTGNNSDSFAYNVTVSESPNMTVSSASVSIVENSSETTQITLANTGNNDLIGVNLSATDLYGASMNISSANIAFSSDSVDIAYGNSSQVNVTVTVPFNTTAGTYTGNITAQFGAEQVQAALTVTVSAMSQSASLVVAPSSGWIKGYTTAAYLNATVQNTGNVNITVTPSFTGLSNGIFNVTVDSVSPISAVVQPGQNQTFRFSVSSIPANATLGSYTGTANFTYAGNQVITGTMALSISGASYDFALTPLAFDESNRNITISKVFTLQNTGNVPLTGVTVANLNIGGEYNWSVNQSSIGTLAVGDSRQLQMNVFVPQNEGSGAHGIGNIQARSAEYNETFGLSISPLNQLKISDLEVKVDGDTESSVENGEKISKDAKPESDVEFKVKVSNLYDDSEDIEITDIVVTVTILDIDDGDDLEEESDSFDLKAEKSDTVTLNFGLPLAIDEGTYDVEISVEGEDDNGIEHRVEWTVKLEINKKNHEVSIKSASISPSTLKCSRSATLNIEAINLGSQDEDETVITITNNDLGISISQEFEIVSDPFDDDNSYDKSVSVRLDRDFPAGTYPIVIKLYYNQNILDDSRIVDLIVEDCSTTPSTPTTPTSNTTVVITPTTPTVTPTSPATGAVTAITTTGTTALPFVETYAYIALLVLAIIVAAGAVILIIIALLKR